MDICTNTTSSLMKPVESVKLVAVDLYLRRGYQCVESSFRNCDNAAFPFRGEFPQL